MPVPEAAKRADWTTEAPNAIRWELWAEQVIVRINGPDGFAKTEAMSSLVEAARHLDEQYDGGFDGLDIAPQTDLSFSYER